MLVYNRSETCGIIQGFQEADVIKEFTYSFGGATAVPIQPVGCVAKWEGDRLTFWGMGQGIYPQRAEIARALGIEPANIRYINKYNGCTFGAVMAASRVQPFIAYIAKMECLDLQELVDAVVRPFPAEA